jgi:Gram-negative porin
MIQKTLRLSAVALASLFAFGAAHAAGATLNLDGNLELDNTYQQTKTNPNPKQSLFTQGGRVELNFSGKATNGDAFVASKGTLLAQKGGGAATDDMWVQFGTGMGDIKLGRFEDVDMWPVGRDTVLNRPADSYRGQFYRGRIGSDVFHGVGTLNVAPGMTFSLGIIDQKGLATRGIRPIFQFSTGGINLKAGLEIGKVGGADFTGLGLTGGMGLAGGSLNVNLANGKVKNNSKHTTIGANYTMDLGPWALLEYGQIKPDAGGASQKITTLGLGYQLSLLGVKGAFVTPALSTSQAKQGSAKSTDTSVRVRFNYGFNAF